MTLATVLVLNALLSDPTGRHHRLEIAEATGLPLATIYPTLARLESAGWTTSAWEEIDPVTVGRPRRRYYQLSSLGAHKAQRAREATRSHRVAWQLLYPRQGEVS
jgi:PadR family transcriptional regulator PadR